MGAFGSISLTTKIGIVLGCLVAVAIVGVFIKLYINKRSLKKQRTMNQDAAKKLNDGEKPVQKELEGVAVSDVGSREHGIFGGGAYERSNSPTASYILSPSTTVVNWSNQGTSVMYSASSSVIDLAKSRNMSVPTMPLSSNPVNTTSSPLRRHPPDRELDDRRFHSATNSIGGSYIPPLPTPRSIRNFGNPQAQNGWVSPLDVHFSRPSTPVAASSMLQSYDPQINFSPEFAKSAQLVTTPASSTGGVKSEAASFVSRDASPAPPTVPSRVVQQTQSSILPTSSDGNSQSSRYLIKGFEDSQVPVPPIPQNYQSLRPRARSPDTATSRSRAHSYATSSVYSATTSILNVNNDANHHSHTRSRSTESQFMRRTRKRSASQKRSSSARGLSRAQDSLRRHSRKLSQSEKRVSRERDQIHFDPRSHHRNRSGSVQGRSVDFDNPRESPFSNANVTSYHSASSSISSSSGSCIKFQPVPKQVLEVNLSQPQRLSNLPSGRARDRSTSETSQGSIGDFYDAYYRHSTLPQMASVPRKEQVVEIIGRGQEILGVGIAVSGNGRWPVPLNTMGGGAFVGETIMEMPSPRQVLWSERGF